MKLFLLFAGALACAAQPTQVDYNTQIKNKPIVMSGGAWTFTAPVAVSSNTNTLPTLSLTQSGTGNALTVTGKGLFNSQITGPLFAPRKLMLLDNSPVSMSTLGWAMESWVTPVSNFWRLLDAAGGTRLSWTLVQAGFGYNHATFEPTATVDIGTLAVAGGSGATVGCSSCAVALGVTSSSGANKALSVTGKASFSSQTDGNEFRANKFTFLNGGSPEWFMSDATSNRLSWTDSSGVQRMWLDGTGAGGAGPYLQTPALFAQSVLTTDKTFQVAAIPSQTGTLVDVTDSGRTTHYLTISAAGVPSGTHFQSLGSADSPTFGNLTVTTSISTPGTLTAGIAGGFSTDAGGNIATGFINASGSIRAGTNFRLGGAIGVTSATCSQFTGGICTVP